MSKPKNVKSPWRSAKDDPPPRGKIVIVRLVGRSIARGWRHGVDWYTDVTWPNAARVSHWMPIPPLPKKEER